MFRISSRPLPESKRRAFDALVGGGAVPCYVLGRNKYAESVAREIRVEAFIDDFTSETSYLGRPVVRREQVPARSLVVSCVVDARPVTALNRLAEHRFDHVLDYFALQRLAPGRFRAVDYSANNENDINQNADQYEWLHQRLADEASRTTLERVMEFRRNWDIDAMRGFAMRTDRQYFDDFVRFTSGEVFVDGGGFDGDTSLRFAALCPGYRQIYYFEPTAEMMAKSKRALSGLGAVTYVQKGLFDRTAQIGFEGTAGSASRIVPSAETMVSVVRLDDEVVEPVSYVKLDIEGAELAALHGARRHIERGHPRLAVCVYHEQSDFWRIPTSILEVRGDYDIYLRHYTEGILETVMYFIPRAK